MLKKILEYLIQPKDILINRSLNSVVKKTNIGYINLEFYKGLGSVARDWQNTLIHCLGNFLMLQELCQLIVESLLDF